MSKATVIAKQFNCSYDEQAKSFVLNGQVLDTLLTSFEVIENGFLPLEQSIQTDFGLLTWTLNTGWIVVPQMNEKPVWAQFEPLQNILKKYHYPISDQLLQQLNENIEGAKLRFAREYLEQLEQYLQDITSMIQSPQNINLDLLTLIIKDFRTSNSTDLTHIKNEIQEEIHSVKNLIEKNKYTRGFAHAENY